MKYKITVFTPTYNRAYIIDKLYNSLKRQTFKNFEWLVIDDGSIDCTEELFQKWINEENEFPIYYYKVQNGGKCRAINKALDLAQGELFFTVDSDDYLTDDALEKVVQWEADIPKSGTFCGVAGNLGITINDTPNLLFENGYYEGTLLDRYKKVNGERAIIFYTNIHRKYKYPEFEGENFMTEAVTWNRMAHDGYLMRFYNDIICIYEYREDGLTKAGNKLFLNNPKGYCLWIKEKSLYEKVKFFKRIILYYTLICELYPIYDLALVSDSLKISKLSVILLWKLHRIVQIIKH